MCNFIGLHHQTMGVQFLSPTALFYSQVLELDYDICVCICYLGLLISISLATDMCTVALFEPPLHRFLILLYTVTAYSHGCQLTTVEWYVYMHMHMLLWWLQRWLIACYLLPTCSFLQNAWTHLFSFISKFPSTVYLRISYWQRFWRWGGHQENVFWSWQNLGKHNNAKAPTSNPGCIMML